jgi:hypothetical protein
MESLLRESAPSVVSWMKRLSKREFRDWLASMSHEIIRSVFVKYLQSFIKTYQPNKTDFLLFGAIQKKLIKHLSLLANKQKERDLNTRFYIPMNDKTNEWNLFCQLPCVIGGEISSYLSTNQRLQMKYVCRDLKSFTQQPNAKYMLKLDHKNINLLNYKLLNKKQFYYIQALTISMDTPQVQTYKKIKHILQHSPHLRTLHVTDLRTLLQTMTEYQEFQLLKQSQNKKNKILVKMNLVYY